MGGLAQSEESNVSNVEAPRSKLGFSISYHACLAQKVERWPFKPMVEGSIPSAGMFCYCIVTDSYCAGTNIV